jgi:hypothetical protein
MSIPQNILPEHILDAIDRIEKQGYDPSRASDKYDLYYYSKSYPPKVVISYANIPVNGVEWTPEKFGGGDESNHFLIKQGFPILQKDVINPTDFFTVEELLFFDEYSGKPYNSKDDVSANAGEFIRNIVCEHSKMWADLIARNLPFKRTGKKAWNERRNNDFGQRFRPYSWYKLHHTEYSSENVFYTVGVEGPRPQDDTHSRLVIKLDCARSKISGELKDKFDQLLDEREVSWHIITAEELTMMNWDDLLVVSKEYIEETLEVLMEAVSIIENNIATKYARITWNEYGWLKPSGRHGKSNADSHEKLYGYGHEEWLFDIEKTIDGYHYGRLEPIKTAKDKHVGSIYNINLYTFNGSENVWEAVAYISNVEVISAEESQRASNIYRNHGWIDEQVGQLKELGDVDFENYRNWDDADRFNIRFKPEDLNIRVESLKEGVHPSTTRYVLLDNGFYDFPDYETEALTEEGALDLKDRNERRSKRTISRTYEPAYTEIENIHGLLQDAFVEYLKNNSKGNVYYEVGRKIDSRRIDIVEVVETKAGKEYTFYEIKTYPSVLHSIRMAIGQLFEYAYYPNLNLTREFVIVSHLSATSDELAYLQHLSAVLGVNVRYICFNYEGKRSSNRQHLYLPQLIN